MDIREIQNLIDWLTERGISEFEFRRGDIYLKLRLGPRGTPVVETSEASAAAAMSAFEAMPTPRFLASPPPPPPAPVAAAPPAPAAQAAPPPPPPAPAAEEASLAKVTSPLVGTFYRRPNPKAEPFVQVGSAVKKGQTLCIVEAMKVMNEIASTADGVVAAVHVEEGETIEYGEALFSIRPA
jgi:acetyl-CoA carboxylase biotin carboxyl carrier protein